ncbi:hypothetical protein [Primorskyibacter sp. 2E233]|uniref:site-specific integrase n=1 Tax=Primorskyibacter sp. 2E233 TaxID=3413431 RepID=UPI003BF12491
MDHLQAQHIEILETLARCQIAAHEKIRASAPPRSEAAAQTVAALEQATQAVLRRALATGNREEARAPLRDVARHLGVTLAEDTDDWNRLAFEAVRLLLDLSAQRERAELGLYDDPSPIFRSARAKTAAAPAQAVTLPQPRPSAPQTPTSLPMTTCIIADASPVEPVRTSLPVHDASFPASAPVEKDPVSWSAHTEIEQSKASEPVEALVSIMNDEASADCNASDLKRRLEQNPPKLNTLPMKRLSPKLQRILKDKPRGISLLEAIDLMEELKGLGLGDEFGKHQVPDTDAGAKWLKDSSRKLNFARRFWAEFVGDDVFENIDQSAIRDALEFLPKIPAKHSKGTSKWAPTVTFADVVERCEIEDELERDRLVAEVMRNPEATEADLEDAKNYKGEARLRAVTITKHRRMISAIGRMLVGLGLADQNPFDICAVSNKELDRMKKKEPDRARTVWDDRFHDLLATPVFQGETSEVGEPMFWAPLLARFSGMREEEILQLGPDDFKSDRGITYIDVKAWDGNFVKTGTSQRKVPLHPALIELGLLKLVELRKQQRQSRLFPHLKRGKAKGKFSELFSKNFNYYRITNDVYWPGLDFHALRTTFNSDLMNADKSDAIRCVILGHELKDEGAASYGQGLLLETMFNRVKDVYVDLPRVVSPFAKKEPVCDIGASKPNLRLVS